MLIPKERQDTLFVKTLLVFHLWYSKPLLVVGSR